MSASLQRAHEKTSNKWKAASLSTAKNQSLIPNPQLNKLKISLNLNGDRKFVENLKINFTCVLE